MGKYYGRIRKIIKVIGWIIGGILLIPLLLILALQIPSIQNYVLKEITQTLSVKLHTKVSLKKVGLRFPKSIKLKEVYIEGQEKDTLLYAWELAVSIDFLKLINKEICISDVRLERAYGNIYRKSGKQDFNYTFIVNAFSDTTAKTPSSWKFDLKKVHLDHVRLDYKDVPGGTSVSSNLIAFKVDFKSLGLEDQQMVIDEADINGLKLSLNFTKPELKVSTAASETPPLQTFIEDLTIQNSYLVYNDFTQKAVAGGIDYNRLSVRELNGVISYVKMNGTDLALAVNELSFKEKCGLHLRHLAGNMNLQQSGIRIELKSIETANSHVGHQVNVVIPSGKESDMRDLAFEGDLKNETIAFKDIQYFMPDLDTLPMLKDKKILISGEMKGKMKDFTLSDLKLKMEGQVDMEADVSAKGLPDLKATYFDIGLQKLFINSAFAAAFVPQPEQRAYLRSLGNIHVNGNLKGYAMSPLASLSVLTEAGDLKANVKLSTDTLFNLKGYSGQVSANRVDLGRILGDTSLGKLTAHLNAGGMVKTSILFRLM